MARRVAVAVVAAVAMAAAVAEAQVFNVLEHLASKGPYFPKQNMSLHTPPPPTCRPLHLNLVARHGSRSSGDDDILEFIRIEGLIEQYASAIRAPYADWMVGWKNSWPFEDEGKLLYTGKMENYEMAKRFKAVYPNLFEGKYNSDVTFLRATQEQRAMMSADSFAYGLLEGTGDIGPFGYEPIAIVADTESEDNILSYYSNCERYIRLVDDNPEANIESPLYLETFIEDIADRLRSALTVNSVWNVTREDTLAFWAICQSEGNAYYIVDQFCSLFTQAEIEKFEYFEDLDDYYTKSYPYEVNYRISAPLIQDMVESMVEAIDGGRQRANLRFAHSGTIVPIVTALGLYRDPVLLAHDSPADVVANRQFRTSYMSNKGTNVAFVLYKCDGGNSHVVKVLQSEREVIVAGCTDLYCPFEQFQAAYRDYLDLDFDTYCST